MTGEGGLSSFLQPFMGLFLPVLLLNLDKSETEFQKYINHQFHKRAISELK